MADAPAGGVAAHEGAAATRRLHKKASNKARFPGRNRCAIVDAEEWNARMDTGAGPIGSIVEGPRVRRTVTRSREHDRHYTVFGDRGKRNCTFVGVIRLGD